MSGRKAGEADCKTVYPEPANLLDDYDELLGIGVQYRWYRVHTLNLSAPRTRGGAHSMLPT